MSKERKVMGFSVPKEMYKMSMKLVRKKLYQYLFFIRQINDYLLLQ